MNRGPTGWRCGWPCSISCWEVPMSDLILISGGRLMDPGQGLDGIRDILVGKGRVLWIGHGPPPQEPDKVLQGRGLVVSPGFVDLHRHLGLPVMDHCEDPELAQEGQVNEGVVSLRLGLRGMPSQAEEAAVARDVAVAGLTGGHVHIHHVSSQGSLEHIRRGKEKGVKVTCEATPHHLTLTEDRLLAPIPYDTNLKVNPPLRTGGG